MRWKSMDKTTVHQILLQHNSWMLPSELLERVKKKMNVKERQAWDYIRKAHENPKEGERIIKHKFHDGTVIYGLPDFGPPSIKENKVYVIQKQKEDLGVIAAIAYYRERGDKDRIPFYKRLVKEYDRANNRCGPKD